MGPLLVERDLHGLIRIEITTAARQHLAKLASSNGPSKEQQAFVGHGPTIGCREASEIVSQVGGESEVDGFHPLTVAAAMSDGKGSVGEPVKRSGPATSHRFVAPAVRGARTAEIVDVWPAFNADFRLP